MSPINLYPVKFFVEDEQSEFNRGNKPNEPFMSCTLPPADFPTQLAILSMVWPFDSTLDNFKEFQ